MKPAQCEARQLGIRYMHGELTLTALQLTPIRLASVGAQLIQGTLGYDV